MTHVSLSDLKAQAKRLRVHLAADGTEISHSRALELIAHQHGARDWNTLNARVAQRNAPFRPGIGDQVSGHYLGQPFTGLVHQVASRSGTEGVQLTLQFDTPVDVVQFDSFSSFRSRVHGFVGPDGRSPRKTSDGVPHLVIDQMA